MTGRHLAVLAGAALIVAVTVVTAQPFLHPARPQATPPDTAPTTPGAVARMQVLTVATVAARATLACPPVPVSTAARNSCGPLTVTRRQLTCTTVITCRVDLIGRLTTRTAVSPIALTITLHRDHLWRATAVRS